MILAIVQARMASSRLPGKVMKEIMGKPMIEHLLVRLSSAEHIDKVILATSTSSENDEMCQYVRNIGFDVYRGSEDDVLDRFYRAAQIYGPEIIVRITGDCPLIDPEVCDELVRLFEKENFDYVRTGPTFAEGIDGEAFTLRALEKAWEEAVLASEREHVTLYICNHPDQFKTRTLVNKTDDSRYRFTVDEEVDFRVATAIFKYFDSKGKRCFSVDDIKAFLDAETDVFHLNAHVVRNEGLLKSISNDRQLGKRNFS